ncbi:efflux RND transporter permease subunit [Mucilaginibacter sp. KACC 22063]|uniref:efflux RND transporter permease subunit n=1 Tax=Mucilaginibacter sp. KACC 22063 TaxID=3025666 RepID=UPI002365A974|nr:MMPL family transporter [Mucilaginibacter sp. KACC 22063]WDF54979.1 MMPL family transporter [Mucilaginibacter sp. KACC 22063]
MIWKKLAGLILKNRLAVIIIVGLLSAFMGWKASKVKLTYNAGKVLPVTDSAYIRFTKFQKKFGQDGTALVLGIKSDKLFNKDIFNDWYQLGVNVQHLHGIKAVISLANIYNLNKDTLQHRFILQPLVTHQLASQAGVDSVKQRILDLPFYDGLVLSEDHKSTLMAITFDTKVVNSPARVPVINEILRQGKLFQQKHGIEVHASGLPLIRTVVSDLVSHEFALFLGLSLLITAIILLIFFRTGYAVIFPVLVVLLGVVWSLGLLVINHFNITLLTGIIPPLVVVIGIPNSIFILNKYYREYGLTGDKMASLYTVIEKVGITTFIANVTTAIGFGVLCFTNSQILMEFGLVASLSIMATFALSIVLVPVIFSYLPDPKARQSGIKDRKFIQLFLAKLDHLVHNYRPAIYIGTVALVAVCFYGMSRINVNGYIVDDLPKTSSVLSNMRFFESNFKGVLPLEVSVESKHKNGLANVAVMRKVERLENLISSYPEFSRSLSLIQVLKFSTQSFYGGKPEFYRLPDGLEQNFILSYAANSGKGTNMLKNYLDSTKQTTRISFQMVDAGSKKLNSLFTELQPRIDSIFNPKNFHVELTGSSVIFVKGNNYLIKNLYESLALAIFLIGIVMWVLFRGVKMIAISLLPNLIPLVITAGIMGFFGIPLKPSTILIFSIAMGISSDQTIYFLTRYRQELRNSKKSISQVVSDTIRETGISMIYIATVLFFGFGIFAASTFGGTVALGILLSITLLIAMITNLTLLPAFLLSMEKRRAKNAEQEPVIDLEAQEL